MCGGCDSELCELGKVGLDEGRLTWSRRDNFWIRIWMLGIEIWLLE